MQEGIFARCTLTGGATTCMNMLPDHNMNIYIPICVWVCVQVSFLTFTHTYMYLYIQVVSMRLCSHVNRVCARKDRECVYVGSM